MIKGFEQESVSVAQSRMSFARSDDSSGNLPDSASRSLCCPSDSRPRPRDEGTRQAVAVTIVTHVTLVIGKVVQRGRSSGNQHKRRSEGRRSDRGITRRRPPAAYPVSGQRLADATNQQAAHKGATGTRKDTWL
jgi:hypothetical protein